MQFMKIDSHSPFNNYGRISRTLIVNTPVAAAGSLSVEYQRLQHRIYQHFPECIRPGLHCAQNRERILTLYEPTASLYAEKAANRRTEFLFKNKLKIRSHVHDFTPSLDRA